MKRYLFYIFYILLFVPSFKEPFTKQDTNDKTCLLLIIIILKNCFTLKEKSIENEIKLKKRKQKKNEKMKIEDRRNIDSKITQEWHS